MAEALVKEPAIWNWKSPEAFTIKYCFTRILFSHGFHLGLHTILKIYISSLDHRNHYIILLDKSDHLLLSYLADHLFRKNYPCDLEFDKKKLAVELLYLVTISQNMIVQFFWEHPESWAKDRLTDWQTDKQIDRQNLFGSC